MIFVEFYHLFFSSFQADNNPVPVLYYLSGLSCTEQNVITKAGAQQHCARHGIALVCPDTSPRGVPIEGDSNSWDFGVGASYYLRATKEPWSKNYKMFDYVTRELPDLILKSFPVTDECSIMGHSMGGMGAFLCALKSPGRYFSVSALAPICNPSQCAWGKKAFTGFLASEAEWKQWDPTHLVTEYDGPQMEILIDQGTDDGCYKDGQLQPDAFVQASRDNSQISVILRMQEGYDHGYYFISTFIGDHIELHAASLLGEVVAAEQLEAE